MSLHLEQGTEEWHKFRNSRVGASDAPVIMGMSPWKTSLKLWQEKLGLIPGQLENSAMRRGKELESRARELFTESTGIEVKQDVLVHQTREWMIASLDGIDKERKNIVEIKCPGQDDHYFAGNSKMVPQKYYPQIQHQIEVSGVDKAYYFSYFDEQNTILLEIGRNDSYIKEMLEKEEEFYECIKNFISPKLTYKDFVCKNDQAWNEAFSEYFMLSKYIKREKELRELLIKMANDENCIGGGGKVQKIIRKGNVDYSAIPELIGVDLEKYRKESIECWKITNV